jgi:DHA1 family bicyclomycin/chloramphenicol resistance-like MFS transporter
MQDRDAALRPLAAFAHAPLLALVVALIMLQPWSTDLYLASLPGIAQHFGAPTATVQLTLSLFVLAFGSAQLVIGPLSDRFGRRPVLLAGLTLYALASLACASAPAIGLLILARVAQAVGCCSAIVIARAIVRDAYAPDHGARVIARVSAWMAIAPLAGPIAGSYLQVAFGWRAAFLVLTLLATVLLAAIAWRLPETNLHKDPRATAPAGLLANYRRVLGAHAFWSHALPGALSYGALFAFISGASPLLIRVLGVPTEWFGYCFATGVCGYLGGTLLCRRLLPRLGNEGTLRFGGTAALSAGMLFLAVTLAGLHHWAIVTAAMFLVMGAHGITFPVAQTGAVAPFPAQAGTAAGLMGALAMLVAFAVGSLVGLTYNGSPYPLPLIVATETLLVFLSVRLLARSSSVRSAA